MNNLVYSKDPTRPKNGDLEKPSGTSTAWMKNDVIARIMDNARNDVVAVDLAGDHAKDMGDSRYEGLKIFDSRYEGLKILDDVCKPPEIATLEVGRNHATQELKLRDDRGFHVLIGWEVLRRLPESGTMFMDTEKNQWLQIRPSSGDRWRIAFTVEDDRGVRYPLNLKQLRPTVRAPIPHRGVLSFGGEHPFNISNNKERQMPTTKETTTKEKPVAERTPKLAVYFQINDLPQKFSQKQVIEHVTKLLSLGAARVNVNRFIQDDATDHNFQNGRYL